MKNGDYKHWESTQLVNLRHLHVYSSQDIHVTLTPTANMLIAYHKQMSPILADQQLRTALYTTGNDS